MTFEKNLKSRISRGIWLFLFCASFAFASDSTEMRINQTAFPLARYSSRYAPVPIEAKDPLRVKIESALTPVRLAPKAWFYSAFSTAPTIGDRQRLLDHFREVDIWKCLGDSCQGCSGMDSLGCVLSAKTSGGIGTLAVIHPCLYGDGKCPRGKKADINLWAERVISDVPFFKLGLSTSDDALRKSRKKSSAWIKATSRSVNQLLGSCPGPYKRGSIEFLWEVAAVSRPNPAIRRCGETYVRAISTLMKRCPNLRKTGTVEWKSFTKEQLKTPPEILRCDSFCQKMLCRKAGSLLVFSSFNLKPHLLVLDGACEGETPTSESAIRDSYPRSLRMKAEQAGCFSTTDTPIDSDVSAGSLGDGPEVQLVE